MKLNKLSVVLLAMFIALFTVSSASAYTLNARSEEMTAKSKCDFAGTTQMFFNADDYTIINNYLGDNVAVVLRVSLSGTDIALDADAPLLCKDISGTANPDANGDGLGDVFPTLPINMVAIDALNIEVSDINNAGAPDNTPDITAYVKGNAGQQFFTIYITGMQPGSTNTDPYWIKVGLYQELLDITLPDGTADPDEVTAICADVHDFSGFSKLTVSIDNTPQTLTTTTSENQIGHFLVQNVELRECDKVEDNDCAITSTIPLCPVVVDGQAAGCVVGSACFVIEGDLPTELFEVVMRTNGESVGEGTQKGVYLRSISASDADGQIMFAVNYYDEKNDVLPDADQEALTLPITCDSKATVAKFALGPNANSFGGKIQFCVTYFVDPEVAEVGTKVRLWTTAGTLPCGNLWGEMYEGADLVQCGGEPGCMYFPYVVSGISPWATGVVVTNLASETISAADMIATFTMTDATGAVFTATKDDFDSVVFSFVVDDVLEGFGWTPAPGNAWLKVDTNFAVDGYSFLTNGGFGAGTLARPCGANHLE